MKSKVVITRRLPQKALTLENCIIAPHIASASVTTRTQMATMAAENLVAGLRGDKLPAPVNPHGHAPFGAAKCRHLLARQPS